jgi:hypothetical protein
MYLMANKKASILIALGLVIVLTVLGVGLLKLALCLAKKYEKVKKVLNSL